MIQWTLINHLVFKKIILSLSPSESLTWIFTSLLCSFPHMLSPWIIIFSFLWNAIIHYVFSCNFFQQMYMFLSFIQMVMGVASFCPNIFRGLFWANMIVTPACGYTISKDPDKVCSRWSGYSLVLYILEIQDYMEGIYWSHTKGRTS